MHRWLRPSLQCNNRLLPIRQEDPPRATPSRELGAEGGDRGDTRVDTQVLYTGAVGEGAGEAAVTCMTL